MLSNLAMRRLPPALIEYIASNTMNAVMRKLAPFFWTYQSKVRITRIERENERVKTFHMLPNQHLPRPRPGQYLAFSLPLDGKLLQRHYSVSSVGTGAEFSITVKQLDNGQGSNWLHAHARPGMTLEVSNPLGQFTYQGQKKIALLSAGVGITPCYGVLNRIGPDNDVDVRMLAIFGNAQQIIYRSSLMSDPRCEVLLRDATPGTKNHAAQISPAFLLEKIPDLLERNVYLCGPDRFMQASVDALQQAGFDLNRLHLERFVADAAPQKANPLAQIRFRAQNITLQMTDEDRKLSLLEIAERHGVHMNHGCRSGFCGTCRIHLISGTVQGNQIGQVIYPCTSYPASELIELG